MDGDGKQVVGSGADAGTGTSKEVGLLNPINNIQCAPLPGKNRDDLKIYKLK